MAGEPEWEGLFDFSHPGIQQWEVNQIQAAEKQGALLVMGHARDRGREHGIQVKEMRDTVRTGKASEKDPPSHPTRDPGIAFTKTLRSGLRIKVKVSYLGPQYAIFTAHPDGKRGDRA